MPGPRSAAPARDGSPHGRTRRPSRHGTSCEPGIGSFSARAVLLEAEARGLACDAFLERLELSRAQLADPDGWVPLRRYAGLYRDAVAASGDPAGYWVGVGGRALVHATRIAGHAAASSSTVREALETWARFAGLVVDLVSYHLESTPRAAVFLARWPPAHASLFLDAHVSATVAFRQFVAYVAGPVRPVQASLVRPPPPSPRAVEEALGAPVRWNGEWPSLVFPRGTFDRPAQFADPGLRALLVQAGERHLASRAAGAVEDRVRAVILRLGFDRSASVATVAGAMAATPRTLQRWLAAESLTFSRIRNDALREAAMAHLSDGSVPVSEVAFRLGFSSRAAFHRAIRRWTGSTPGQVRAGSRPPPTPT